MTAMAVVGAAFVVLSPLQPWIEAPIRGQAHGGASFAWAALLVAGLAMVAAICRAHRLIALSGVAGLGLCAFSVLHLTFFDPIFWPLVDENVQYAQIISFSHRYLPANLGSIPTFQGSLSTDTVLERLVAASYFSGLGWWACVVGGLLLIIGGCAGGGGRTRRWTVLTAMVVYGSQGLLLGKGMVAQHFQDSGDRYMARGQYAEAVRQYEAALRYDRQLAGNERLHRYAGEAYDHLGTPTHPQARLYRGDRYVHERNLEAATAEYQLALQDASGPLTSILRHRLAWTYIKLGLVRYGEDERGGAIAWWEKALSLDASQLQAAYFLMRAYFDQGRYEQSIAMGQFLTEQARNPLLMADVQANIGDSYWKLKDFSRARVAYEASMRLDTYANFRIYRSLGGT